MANEYLIFEDAKHIEPQPNLPYAYKKGWDHRTKHKKHKKKLRSAVLFEL